MIFSKNRKCLALAISTTMLIGVTTNSNASEAHHDVLAPFVAQKEVVVKRQAKAKRPTVALSKPAKPQVLVNKKTIVVKKVADDVKVRGFQSGMASYYGPGFHGRRTANGETFNMHAMTAAHRTLPFGTKLKVTNLNNGQSTIVRVNDRGPYAGGRVLDLSVAAAQQIGAIQSGVAKVKIEVVQQ